VRRAAQVAVFLCQFGWFLLPAASQAIHVQGPRPRAAMAVSSLTLTATPSFVHFDLVEHGVSAGSGPIQVTTRWGGSLCLITCTIRVYGYFPSASSALAGGSPRISIPSSAVLGRVTNGNTPVFTPFTGTSPFGVSGSSLLLSSHNFSFSPLADHKPTLSTSRSILPINVHYPQEPFPAFFISKHSPFDWDRAIRAPNSTQPVRIQSHIPRLGSFGFTAVLPNRGQQFPHSTDKQPCSCSEPCDRNQPRRIIPGAQKTQRQEVAADLRNSRTGVSWCEVLIPEEPS